MRLGDLCAPPDVTAITHSCEWMTAWGARTTRYVSVLTNEPVEALTKAIDSDPDPEVRDDTGQKMERKHE
jgi:hypothetical protein